MGPAVPTLILNCWDVVALYRTADMPPTESVVDRSMDDAPISHTQR